MVTGDRDRVKARHMRSGVGNDVGNDPHRFLWGINIGITDHELFQDVVLQRTGKTRLIHTLLFPGNNKHGKYGNHRAIHGHGNRHLVQRNSVEQNSHILDGINSDSGHTDVSGDPRMVRVITPVGGKIKGD